MTDFNVVLYKNTGFTVNNIPDSKTLIETIGVPCALQSNSYRLLERQQTMTLKIASHYDDIKDVDYCLIGDWCYWVTFNMRNASMAELTLQLDALTTIGLQNLDFSSGWVTRKHVENDGIFDNTLSEPFLPSEPLVLSETRVIAPAPRGNDVAVVLSTVDLAGDIDGVARTFSDKAADLQVTVPIIPTFGVDTHYKMTIDGVERTRKIPATTAYNHNTQKVRDNIQVVRSLGIEQAITGSYIVPREYVSEIYEHEGVINAIENQPKTVSSGINPAYGAYNNRKVYSGQFQKVVLASVCGGNQHEYDVADISDGEIIEFILYADPSPEGRPYCRPKKYKSNTNQMFIGVVEGVPWQNQPIAYGTNSASLINSAYTSRSVDRNLANGIAGMGWGAFNTVAGVGTLSPIAAMNGVRQIGGNFINSVYNTSNDRFDEMINNNIYAPELKFAQVSGLQNYIGNFFIAFRYRLSDNDSKRFDTFLTMNGYSVSEPLSKEDLNNRKNFNYIQCRDVNIINNNFPLWLRQQAIEQLERGVRIWHVKPSSAYYNNNPLNKAR